MDTLVLAAVQVVLMLLFGVAATVVMTRRGVWKPLLAHRVIVQLDAGNAISGVLIERRGPLLVLADAHVHTPGEPPVKADGRSVVERSRVLWIQVV